MKIKTCVVCGKEFPAMDPRNPVGWLLKVGSQGPKDQIVTLSEEALRELYEA